MKGKDVRNTTEDVGTGTLEERGDTLGLDDLATSVEHTVVVDLLSRGHHHATTDGVERVGSDTGTGGDSPVDEMHKETSDSIEKSVSEEMN